MTTYCDNPFERTILGDLNDGLQCGRYLKKHKKKCADIPHKEMKKHCLDISDKICSGKYDFGSPIKKLVAKPNSTKKRVVYTFNRKDDPAGGIVLSRLSQLITRKYDDLLAPNLYSYRPSQSIVTAARRLKNTDLTDKYAYKVDVSNYFNSIPVGVLLNELTDDIDEDVFNVINDILRNNKVIFNGEIIEDDDKGVMAGTSLSSFLSNYYLRKLDWMFHEKGVLYLRFADDIIVFGKSEEEVDSYRKTITEYIKSRGLNINPDKEDYYKPGDRITFLGLDFFDGEIDLSERAMKRIKNKIKKCAKYCRNQVELNRCDPIIGACAMCMDLNNRLFGSPDFKKSWSAWYFPLLTTDRSMKVIDEYAQQQIRYVITGIYSKKNFRIVPYQILKECGYQPIVSRYYGGGSSA